MGMKSKCACEFSIERIENPYLWTFTLPVWLEPKTAAALWTGLARDLARKFGMCGIRVFEPHPKGHGLHVHAVVSGWFPVGLVRYCTALHGWGRIHACKIKKGEGVYIAKYLSKSKRNEGWKGIRLWGAFGQKNARDWKPSKVKDIECISPTIDLYRKFAAHVNPTSRSARHKLWKRAQLVQMGVMNYKMLPPSPARRLYMGGNDLWSCADTIEISAGRPTIRFEHAEPFALLRDAAGKMCCNSFDNQ
jgi:hypothetical protein